MGMPNNLVLVRHGESEGNVATARSKAGDHTDYEGEFGRRHSSLWRLTNKGRQQARATGTWLHEHLKLTFDRHYVSEYVRAMETAANLFIPNAQWFTEFYLRERDWGLMDRISAKERAERFPDSLRDRQIDPFYWTPPNGESMAQLCLRVDRMIDTLHREFDGKNVIIVCHGEVMWAFRVRLERMSQEKFHFLDSSKDPIHRIHNCQVIHYTRTDPKLVGNSPAPYLGWMRSYCPWMDLPRDPVWQEIVRPRYSSADLIERVERTPLLLEV